MSPDWERIEGFIRVNAVRIWARARHLLRMQDEHDLMQAGYEGAIQALLSWRESHGVPFLPFAHSRITGAIWDAVRKETGRYREGSDPRPVFESLTPEHDPISRDLAPEESTIRAETIREVQAALRFLGSVKPRNHDIMVGRYIHGREGQDVARDYGVTGSRIGQLSTESLGILRRYLLSLKWRKQV